MRHSSARGILFGLALAFAVLVAVSFLLMASSSQESKTAAWVVHTRDVLDKIDEMVSALSDAETGRRGYIVSGQQRYRTHFDKKVAHAYQTLGQLRQLTRDNLPQTTSCNQLEPLIVQRLTISTNSMSARDARGLDPSAQTSFMEQGQQAMELVRQLAAKMAARESDLLKQRQAVQDRNIKVTKGFAVLLGVCGLALFSALYVLFWKSDARRRQAEEELERSNRELEERVRERTEKLQTQLARLDLLSHTTRAIAERQDPESIFRVVLRSLEDNLPIDFGCVCLYEPGAPRLTVAKVGTRSHLLGTELGMSENARIDIDQNGMARCVQGELVHEPDITGLDFPFPRRLARAGLSSIVIAPLLVESRVFGVLVAARKQPNSFSSGDCEFLRQLSEHVALASHQAQIYAALQQAYDDLRKTQQAAAQQERLRALGQMASGIAHDINNAISPAAIYSEFLLQNEPSLSARAKEYLQTISSAIEDVAATVVRMREFYRQREAQPALAPVQLNELIDQVLSLTRARWSDMPQQQGTVVEARTDLAKDLPAILGVESEIRDALTNLVLNAVDAMPQGGALTVRTCLRNERPGQVSVCVEVIDTGMGMSEETQRRCLEPFFTTKGERGTGLGLAMVYGMAQRHGADIEIQSAPGKGTTISLSFAPYEPGVRAPAGSETSRPLPRRLRLLVIDDDPLLVKSLSDILEADGHVVVTAAGGQAGIEAFEARLLSGDPFHAVITDLGMPYIDGRSVASAVKTRSPSTPVILLTGWGHRLLADGNLPENVDRVLSKPSKLSELRKALADVGSSSADPSPTPAS